MGIRPIIVLLVSLAFVSLTLAQYPPSQNTRTNTVQNQLEFHTALAERLYNLMATLTNTNVNLVLWLKKSLISFLVRAISYGSYFVTNNQQFVSNQITLISDVIRSFVLNAPYFSVPSVAKSAAITGTVHNYPMPQATEPSWLYEMPNHSFLSTGSDENEYEDRK